MQLLLCIICIALGALGGAVASWAARRPPQNPTNPETALGDEQPPERVLKQWKNFLNYDGSERGQCELED